MLQKLVLSPLKEIKMDSKNDLRFPKVHKFHVEYTHLKSKVTEPLRRQMSLP